MKYDYLIVGSRFIWRGDGTRTDEEKGKRCLVIDKRSHIAGNIYCEDIEGIHVHKYGAHIFPYIQ